MFPGCDNILTREVKIGGQEHFYFETQSCIVTPIGNCISTHIFDVCMEFNDAVHSHLSYPS